MNTSLEYLGMRGVRSFSPLRMEKIKFDKPLTIVFGGSGKGKSSIIECLKVGFTGRFPGGSQRGRYWIHDPPRDGETNGQVKLQLSAISGKKVMVIRSFLVTQKTPIKRDFKQLDVSLQCRDENKTIQQVSHRCSEANNIIPQLFGTKTSYLNYVVFSTREEANWPLGDPAQLREKILSFFANRGSSSKFGKGKVFSEKSTKDMINQYHDMKIMEVNNSIRHFWRMTHNGDIEDIELVSEVNSSGSCRYSVQIVKNGERLDMRSRCSSSEKSMASIIIRLAFFESFGCSSGIFTLDDPTANLDQKNTIALGRLLARVLEERKMQVNFQLIIVTQDEEFMRMLVGSGVKSTCYRLGKDDNFCSWITKIGNGKKEEEVKEEEVKEEEVEEESDHSCCFCSTKLVQSMKGDMNTTMSDCDCWEN